MYKTRTKNIQGEALFSYSHSLNFVNAYENIQLLMWYYLQVDLDVEEDQEREGDEAEDEEPAPAVVAGINRIGPEIRQLDRGFHAMRVCRQEILKNLTKMIVNLKF